jgi:hypothetical protein
LRERLVLTIPIGQWTVNGRRVSGSVQPDLSAIDAAAESGALCLERRRIKSYPFESGALCLERRRIKSYLCTVITSLTLFYVKNLGIR